MLKRKNITTMCVFVSPCVSSVWGRPRGPHTYVITQHTCFTLCQSTHPLRASRSSNYPLKKYHKRTFHVRERQKRPLDGGNQTYVSIWNEVNSQSSAKVCAPRTNEIQKALSVLGFSRHTHFTSVISHRKSRFHLRHDLNKTLWKEWFKSEDHI